MECLGASLEVSWGVLDASLESPGASWHVLEASWATLEASWDALPIFNRSEAVLESSWGRLGGVFRTFWDVFGGVLRRVFREISQAKQAFLIFGIKMKCWRPLGSVLGFLEVYWDVFEVSWRALEASLERLGATLEVS